MVDNIAVSEGSGKTVATDDIGGIQYQRVKVTWGPDGTGNDSDVASGKPLPVQLRGSDGTDRSNLLPVSLATAPALVAGSAVIGKVGIDQTTPGTTNLVALGANQTVNSAQINGVTPLMGNGATGTGSQRVTIASDNTVFSVNAVSAGDIANDAADSGNPVKVGSRAIAGQSTATLVAAADRVENYAGLDGVQLVRPHCGLEDIVSGNATNTDGTSTLCIPAQAAGIKTYLTSIVLCNTSATAITVDIKDGATVKVSLPLPAGGGCIFNPPVPVPGTAATAWNFDGSAAATTVTCSMVGFKSKV